MCFATYVITLCVVLAVLTASGLLVICLVLPYWSLLNLNRQFCVRGLLQTCCETYAKSNERCRFKWEMGYNSSLPMDVDHTWLPPYINEFGFWALCMITIAALLSVTTIWIAWLLCSETYQRTASTHLFIIGSVTAVSSIAGIMFYNADVKFQEAKWGYQLSFYCAAGAAIIQSTVAVVGCILRLNYFNENESHMQEPTESLVIYEFSPLPQQNGPYTEHLV